MHQSLKLTAVTLVLVFVLSDSITLSRSNPEDAELIEPIANFVKMTLGTLLLGEPFNVELTARSLLKSFPIMAWKTRLPLRMTSIKQTSQEFYDRIHQRVTDTDVTNFERMTLKGLKDYLDNIINEVVAEVGRNKDGLLMDFNKVMVNGDNLEQALVNVGLQLKAYSIDLTNYRDIANAVLGLPVVPTMASGVLYAAKLPQGVMEYTGIDGINIRNLPSNSFNTVTQFGRSAAQTVMNPSSIITGYNYAPSIEPVAS